MTLTLTGIVIIILLGIILLLLEILVVPGVGVVGILGAMLMFTGVFLAYNIDSITGHCVLGGSTFVAVALGYLSFRAKTWEKIMLKSELKGKVNTLDHNSVAVGDKGIATSRLAPIGKARINNVLLEVDAAGEFIDENSSVQVTKIIGPKIIVKQVK